MDEPKQGGVPQELTEALDTSVRDLASGAVHDAGVVQAEARRLLDAHERIDPMAPGRTRPVPSSRARTA